MSVPLHRAELQSCEAPGPQKLQYLFKLCSRQSNKQHMVDIKHLPKLQLF